MIDGQFTLGVEEEYQIVHPESRDLRSYVSRLIEDGKSVLRERVRPEMHQSMVEVGTTICKDVGAVRSELCEMRGELDKLARKGGLRIMAASTHPFADWKQQDITDHARYHNIVHDMQDMARANLIFGLHVHVGIKEKQVALAMANQIRYFLPHLLALTCSSPFWMGRNTGLKSMRCQIFKRFPRTGIPDEFESVEQLERFVNTLIKTGCMDNGKKLWWDVRPHYLFDTVEVRICDMPTNMDHTIAVVALIQALMAKLYLMYRRNTAWRTYARALIDENKWRAIRYGTEAKMIDFGIQEEKPFAGLIDELIDFVKEATDIFGTGKHMEVIREIARGGTSAHRQIEVYEKSNNDIRAVCDWLMAETMRGI
ncbi:MAG: carboxylate-amine ligase [Deltaproteobacteria bacterium]|nr:carboxylate-amine ligase [Deltaproteobacteria bacterium]